MLTNLMLTKMISTLKTLNIPIFCWPCTRHLLEDLQGSANPRPVLSWLEECWDDLKDLANTKVEFEKLGVEAQINQFANLRRRDGRTPC